MHAPQAVIKGLVLSEALRDRTSKLHAEAERSGVINQILRRKADRRSYALLLRNLFPAYMEMERALELHRQSPVLSVFSASGIRRSERIASDLVALSGKTWSHDLPVLPAGETYASVLRAAGEGNGVRLVAHAYVRYFGDLSGGQVLKRLLGSSLAIPDEALSFYEFPEISNPKAVKEQMRDVIDSRFIDAESQELVIEEGIRAFELNIALSLAVQSHAEAMGWA